MAEINPILSSQLFLSREQIRNQLIDQIQNYLELVDVDLTKSSFITYIIDILSTLSSNILFYQMSVYKEFFLTKAQLPESVLNLANFIGYTPKEANYASCNITLTFPFTFQDPRIEFVIPNQTKFQTGDGVQFISIFETKVIVENNSFVQAHAISDNSLTQIPVYIDNTYNTFSIMIPVVQKEIKYYEFQIDQDMPQYRFSEYNIRFEGQLAGIEVQVKDPKNDYWVTYDRFSSIYLMTDSDYGYVAKPSNNGYNIYFGNGLIGVQPPAGGTIKVVISTTLGSRGNIIANTIVSGVRLNYQKSDGSIEHINYQVTNPAPAIGGSDIQSLEQIKYSAIDNLTSLHRFVSQDDYLNIRNINPNIPLMVNSIPVLKRSDVRNNEILIFTTLSYNDEIIPTRNVYLVVDPSTTHIPRHSIFIEDGEEYITLFDLTIDSYQELSHYTYVVNNLELVPQLIKNQKDIDFIFELINFKVQADSQSVTFKTQFQSISPGYDQTTCKFVIEKNMITFDMSLDLVENEYSITFDPYTIIPDGEQIFYLLLSHPLYGEFAQYQVKFIFRRLLDDIMLSNTFVDDNTNEIHISDIPMVLREYYVGLESQNDFEYYVLQRMLTSIDMSDKRMLTDFANLKFPRTRGTMTNMLHNRVNKVDVLDMYLEQFDPIIPDGTRYILSGKELPEFENLRHYIAQYNLTGWGLTNPADPNDHIEFMEKELVSPYDTWIVDYTIGDWVTTEPQMDDIVYVINKNSKYILSTCGWVVPIFTVPLHIKIDIEKDKNTSLSAVSIIDSIKMALLDKFQNNFGNQMEISRSEIIALTQSITGVDHCKLVEPTFNIFYNYELQDLTEVELLKYSPEYLFFREEDIEISII